MYQPKTPKQLVNDAFGGRSGVVDAIVGILGDEEGLRSRLMGTTNKKLLRIHEVSQAVQNSGELALLAQDLDADFLECVEALGRLYLAESLALEPGEILLHTL